MSDMDIPSFLILIINKSPDERNTPESAYRCLKICCTAECFLLHCGRDSVALRTELYRAADFQETGTDQNERSPLPFSQVRSLIQRVIVSFVFYDLKRNPPVSTLLERKTTPILCSLIGNC